MSGRILVAGVGNIFMGDDAFGVEVIRRLTERSLPEGIYVCDFGIRGFDLAYAMMDSWDCVLLVDALQRGGAPGTLYVLQHQDELHARPAELQPHGMDPLSALELVKTLGGAVPPLIVIGCEPEDLGGRNGSMGLTTTVEAAIGPAIALIMEHISRVKTNPSVPEELNA